MPENKLHLILHGHFYQPPREEPWTLEIDRQPSAHPFHDWNERINKECYAANAASRVLDSAGRIEDILNNYEYISFNFGPTLMQWIKRKDPATYRKIYEADRESMKRCGGHGNAIAQVYNHMIMPLASHEDRLTQIRWGLESFERDFGRKAEGIWLAETAVNDQVAEALIAEGVKFIILAPTQAQAVRPIHGQDHEWTDVSNNNIDPSKPYILREKNGELAVFFYYGSIATKISFEHLLRNVDFLRGELLACNVKEKPDHLVHVATDGETYGHHEPFGDMCLSRMIFENRERNDFIFTNYGQFLELFPPQELVRLKEGNEGLGTAWSCAHGVDRWRKDCGCSTGGGPGWNQKWREPFRNALDLLRHELYKSAKHEFSALHLDPFALRDAYFPVAASPAEERENALTEFWKANRLPDLTPEKSSLVVRILEALHYEMLMYTSCGWFFTEISGIETVQDMKYAARVFQLASDILPHDLKDRFLAILETAVSNVPAYQNGRWIYENFVDAHVFSERHILNEYVLSRVLFEEQLTTGLSVSRYTYCLKVGAANRRITGGLELFESTIELYNEIIAEHSRYLCYLFREGHSIRCYIKKFTDESLKNYLDSLIAKYEGGSLEDEFRDWFPPSLGLKDVSYDERERFAAQLYHTDWDALRKFQEKPLSASTYLNILDAYAELGLHPSERDKIGLSELFNQAVMRRLDTLDQKCPTENEFHQLKRIIESTRHHSISIDLPDMLKTVRDFVLDRMNAAIVNLDLQAIHLLEKVIDFTNESGLDFEKYEIQNLLFARLETLTSNEKGPMNETLFNGLLRIAAKFNIAVAKFENRFLRAAQEE